MAAASGELVGVGKIVAGRYAILRPLGRGGVGRVWLAEDLQRDRRLVAFKSAPPSVVGEVDARAASLKQEFRVLTRLRHPHLVRVYEIGALEGGARYLTEEYVEGETLDNLIGHFPAEHLEVLCAQLLQALDYLERKGVLHRDIKPSNAVVQWRLSGTSESVQPEVKLLDFGLAHTAQGDSGLKGGTRRFMAPEVQLGMAADALSELYSLGATLYCMVSGEPPMEVPDMASLLSAPVVDLSSFPVPSGVRGVLKRLLSVSRSGRFASAREALEELVYRSGGRLGEEVLRESPTQLDDGALVGRRELLDEMLARCRAGEAARWVLVGPAGFGKRRLAREFEIQAQLMERSTFRIEVSPGNPPYQIPVALIDQLEGRRLGRTKAPRVEKAAPWQERRRGSALSSTSEAFEPMLLRRLEEASRFDTLPVVLIEDVDLADPYSLGILARWCKGPAAFCLVATAQAIPAAMREAVDAVEIRPLSRGEVKGFLEDRFGAVEVPEAVLERLAEISGGSPANLRSVCVELLRRGLLRSRRADVWTLRALPEDFAVEAERAFEEGLDGLSVAGMRVLESLALLERPVSEGWMCDLLDRLREDWEMKESLVEEGRQAELFRDLELRSYLRIEREGGRVSLRPPGERLLKTIKARLPEARLAQLHRVIGERLAVDWAREGVVGAREVAYHLQRGEDQEQARGFELVAALEAIEVGAIDRAFDHLSYSLKARSHGVERAYVRLLEGILAMRQVDRERARTAFIEAVQLGQGSYVGALAHVHLARLALDRGQVEAAQEVMRTLARRWPGLSSTYLIERLRGTFAQTLMQYEAAVLAYARCGEIAAEWGWREGVLEAQLERGSCLLAMGEVGAAEPVYEALLSVIRASARPPELAGEVWIQWGWLHYLKGQEVAAWRYVARGLDLLREGNAPRGRVEALVMLATMEIEQDRPEDALGRINEAIEFRRKGRERGEQLMLSGLHHLARVGMRQDVEASLETLEALYSRSRPMANPLKRARLALLVARGHAMAGDKARAMVLIEEVLREVASTPTGRHMLGVMARRMRSSLTG